MLGIETDTTSIAVLLRSIDNARRNGATLASVSSAGKHSRGIPILNLFFGLLSLDLRGLCLSRIEVGS